MFFVVERLRILFYNVFTLKCLTIPRTEIVWDVAIVDYNIYPFNTQFALMFPLSAVAYVFYPIYAFS